MYGKLMLIFIFSSFSGHIHQHRGTNAVAVAVGVDQERVHFNFFVQEVEEDHETNWVEVPLTIDSRVLIISPSNMKNTCANRFVILEMLTLK